MKQLHTVGHSIYEMENFVALLKKNSINTIVDVRSMPYSKFASQYNREILKHYLKENKICYIFMGDLLGARYEDKNLLDLAIEERAHKGIFLAFQYPLEIPGVNTNIFLKTSLNAIKKSRGEKELDAIEFLKLVKQKASKLKFDETILSRQLNVGFSGGEKKKNEILQMSILNPKLSILDETDSGLDIDALKIVSEGVNALRNKKNSFFLGGNH